MTQGKPSLTIISRPSSFANAFTVPLGDEDLDEQNVQCQRFVPRIRTAMIRQQRRGGARAYGEACLGPGPGEARQRAPNSSASFTFTPPTRRRPSLSGGNVTEGGWRRGRCGRLFLSPHQPIGSSVEDSAEGQARRTRLSNTKSVHGMILHPIRCHTRPPLEH